MGSIVASSSAQSRVGSKKYYTEQFINLDQSCSLCEGSRYMRCINNTCQCEIHTYFDGSICQKCNVYLYNVWVDADNKLHLKLHKSPTTGGWTCAELYSKVRFSFGTFRWFVEGAIDKLDTNVVLGLFTYGGIDGTNEIDIEMAKWGRTESEASNLFYTTYPHTLDVAKPVSSGTRISLQGTYTTHQFIWNSYNVVYQSQHGFMNSSHENIFYSYTTPIAFTSAMPHISAP
ncbi:unnamed protein product, partial [Adineta steineri]